MSEEKTQTPIDHRPHAAPSGGGAAVAVAERIGVSDSMHLAKPARPTTPTAPMADLIAPKRPTLITTVATTLALIAAVLAMGFGWFGTQPMSDGALVLAIILVCMGVHLFSNLKHQAVVAGAALLLLLLTVWHHAFAEMWIRWFPAWESHKNAPITTRLSAGDSYYSHGPLVPFASIIICYLIHQRVGVPTGVTRSSRLWGGMIFGFSLLMQTVAARGDVNFLSGFALIGILAGLVILWGGWPLARAYWLPVVFLLFMVPLPMDTIAKINYELKTVASRAALVLTNQVFGVVAVLDGATVHLVPEADGTPKTLVVENVCGGLRSMISLICFGTLFALVCRVKGYWRWFMLALSVPLAIGCNVLRITSMNVVAHHFSVAAAGEESWFHTASGISVFAMALAAMFAIEQAIIWASKRWKKDWVDQRLLGYLDELPPSRAEGVHSHHPAVLCGLVIVGAMTTFWVFEAPTLNRGNVAKAAVPAVMEIAGDTYRSTDGEMSRLEMTILQTNDYLKRRYTGGKRGQGGMREVDLTIVFSANNRKGTHPPEVCLEGGGGRIVSKQMHEVNYVSLKDDSKRSIEVRELISEVQGYQTLHMYFYKCGDSYTPNYMTQQAIIFVNGIVARNTTGALIRVDVQIGRPDPVRAAEARQFALTAIDAFIPKIDQGLP